MTYDDWDDKKTLGMTGMTRDDYELLGRLPKTRDDEG